MLERAVTMAATNTLITVIIVFAFIGPIERNARKINSQGSMANYFA